MIIEIIESVTIRGNGRSVNNPHFKAGASED
jgi:hypothetical protein